MGGEHTHKFTSPIAVNTPIIMTSVAATLFNTVRHGTFIQSYYCSNIFLLTVMSISTGLSGECNSPLWGARRVHPVP